MWTLMSRDVFRAGDRITLGIFRGTHVDKLMYLALAKSLLIVVSVSFSYIRPVNAVMNLRVP
jgi:hypothetical protein